MANTLIKSTVPPTSGGSGSGGGGGSGGSEEESPYMDALIAIVKSLYPGATVTPQRPYGRLTPGVQLVTASGRVARVSGSVTASADYMLVILTWEHQTTSTSLGSWQVRATGGA